MMAAVGITGKGSIFMTLAKCFFQRTGSFFASQFLNMLPALGYSRGWRSLRYSIWLLAILESSFASPFTRPSTAESTMYFFSLNIEERYENLHCFFENTCI